MQNRLPLSPLLISWLLLPLPLPSAHAVSGVALDWASWHFQGKTVDGQAGT